jgi:hypothetical protein
MLAFVKRFLMHHGIYRRSPWDGFPPCAMRGAPLSPDAMRLSQRSDQQSRPPGVDFGRPAKFMISRNMHRRYLNPGQCAMIGLPASHAPALMPVAAKPGSQLPFAPRASSHLGDGRRSEHIPIRPTQRGGASAGVPESLRPGGLNAAAPLATLRGDLPYDRGAISALRGSVPRTPCPRPCAPAPRRAVLSCLRAAIRAIFDFHANGRNFQNSAE